MPGTSGQPCAKCGRISEKIRGQCPAILKQQSRELTLQAPYAVAISKLGPRGAGLERAQVFVTAVVVPTSAAWTRTAAMPPRVVDLVEPPAGPRRSRELPQLRTARARERRSVRHVRARRDTSADPEVGLQSLMPGEATGLSAARGPRFGRRRRHHPCRSIGQRPKDQAFAAAMWVRASPRELGGLARVDGLRQGAPPNEQRTGF
jgi:hypothetical protein